MTSPGLSPAARRRNIVAVTGSMAVASLVHGMTLPLLGLSLHGFGTPAWLIGINTAAQSAAVLVTAPLAARWMQRYGPAWPILIAIVAMAMLTLTLPALPNVAAWFPLRFLLGVAGTVLWITGEAWINQVAEDHNRGRVVAIYSMATGGGFALGPLILTLVGSAGWTPFLVMSGITLLVAIPCAWAIPVAPAMAGRPSGQLYGYILEAPLPIFTSGLFAAVDAVLLTFLPLYVLSLGLDASTGLGFVTVFGLGGLACQLPVGWLADHMDRRRLMVGGIVLLLAGTALIPFVIDARPWCWVHAFFYGGAISGIYTVGMVLLGERYRDAELASASSAFGLMWGLGSLAGPPIGGFGMRLYDPHGMVLTIGLMFAAFLPLPVAALMRRNRSKPAPGP